MKKGFIISCLLALSVAAGAADNTSRMKVLEDGREYRSEALRLPSAAVGALDIKACAACPARSLPLAPDATFFIGKEQVELTELRAHLNANPRIAVLVVSPISKQVVSRIVAMATTRQ